MIEQQSLFPDEPTRPRLRVVRNDERAERGRRTVYDGTEYRSTTEALYARWLRDAGFDFEYEDRRVLGRDGVSYLRDFIIDDAPIREASGLTHRRSLAVEVKSSSFWRNDRWGVPRHTVRKMTTLWETWPGLGLVLDVAGELDEDGYDGETFLLLRPSRRNPPNLWGLASSRRVAWVRDVDTWSLAVQYRDGEGLVTPTDDRGRWWVLPRVAEREAA